MFPAFRALNTVTHTRNFWGQKKYDNGLIKKYLDVEFVCNTVPMEFMEPQ